MALETYLREFLEKEKSVSGKARQHYVVALSGGKDSVALLASMKAMRNTSLNAVQNTLQEEYSFTLSAVHVEHGIREEAMDDAAFCQALCDAWEIPLTIIHVKAKELAEKEHLSLEDAARRLRYGAFEQVVRSIESKAREKGEDVKVRVLLAHHAKDQAETVLLHLLRGTGLRGLAGMKEERDYFVRPLLRAGEQEILDYLEEHDLSFVQDQTNFDSSYTRNRIRNQLIPLLENEYNPEIVSGLSRMASRLREEEELLDAMTRESFPNFWDAEGRVLSHFDLREFDTVPPAIGRRGLRLWLEGNGLLKDIEEEHIEALMDLCKGRTGRSVSLPRGLTVRKSYDILYFTCFSAEVQKERGFGEGQPMMMEVLSREEFDREMERRGLKSNENGTGIPDLPDEKWMDADKTGDNLTVRCRKEGDYILIRRKTPEGIRLGKQKLQDLFINEKVPRERRKEIRLLANESHILWAIGVRMSDAVKISEETKRVLHVVLRSEASEETK